MLLNARTLARGGGRPDLILLAIEDVTERKRAEETLRESAAMTRAGVQTAVDGVITIDEHAIDPVVQPGRRTHLRLQRTPR